MNDSSSAPRILVGTAGWADRDLIASGWYPADVRTPAGRLAFYAARFPFVEVDSSYYAIPREQTVLGWAGCAEQSGLVMDVKAYSLLTGQRTRVATLPADLRALTAREWLTAESVSAELLDATWRRFHDSVEPLRQAGRLGLVTLQFPPWYVCDERGKRLVEQALDRCAPLQAAVEFRHPSWTVSENQIATLKLLRAHGAAFVCVDMPQAHSGTVPPILATTCDKAVIRMHGRSPDWREGGKEDRYRYEYPDDELAGWALRARELSRHADEVHVVLNTCCAGAAQRAAARIKELIEAG
ncbi:MAG TPA: DUF72 domain-containing protein [Actinocrinis sp.]|nr:DUF72 domain-containing protein [Actinocrinis sp.]